MKLGNIKEQRVLIRVDYNVPIKNNKVIDSNRIQASYKTIDYVLKKGGIPILISHLGDGSDSLRPVATFLSKKYKIVFVTKDILDSKILEIFEQVPKGTVILLENIRRYEQEEKNLKIFAKSLSSLGNFYINDAFSVSHRSHASVVGIPKFLPSSMGFNMENEIKSLQKAQNNKKHPFIFILGGAKFKTKIPLINRFAENADRLVITGALLNNFYKVSGFEVGKSVVEEGYDNQIKKILKNPKLLLPIDVMVLRGTEKKVLSPVDVDKNDVIVDIGTQSVDLISKDVEKAKLVVWNGPTGWYEKGFRKATESIAKSIIKSKTNAIIGGGDTGAVLSKLMTEPRNGIFISTGGGATLDYLSNGTLPGIEALK